MLDPETVQIDDPARERVEIAPVGRGIEIAYETFGDSGRPAAAPRHGARHADARAGRRTSAACSPTAASA